MTASLIAYLLRVDVDVAAKQNFVNIGEVGGQLPR